MDFGKAFTFMFQDPDWLRKLGIGTLLMLVGIVLSPILIGLIPIIIVMGYTVDVVRNVLDRKELPLPAWEDWGGFLSRGLKLMVAFLVWSLPILIVMVPMIAGSIMLDNQTRSGVEGLGLVLVICSSCLMIIWGILEALVSPAVYIRVARTGRIGSAFELDKVWSITKHNLGNVIIAILLVWVASLIAGIGAMAGLIALVIGVIVTFPLASLWQYLVQAHLFGQIGAESAVSID